MGVKTPLAIEIVLPKNTLDSAIANMPPILPPNVLYTDTVDSTASPIDIPTLEINTPSTDSTLSYYIELKSHTECTLTTEVGTTDQTQTVECSYYVYKKCIDALILSEHFDPVTGNVFSKSLTKMGSICNAYSEVHMNTYDDLITLLTIRSNVLMWTFNYKLDTQSTGTDSNDEHITDFHNIEALCGTAEIPRDLKSSSKPSDGPQDTPMHHPRGDEVSDDDTDSSDDDNDDDDAPDTPDDNDDDDDEPRPKVVKSQYLIKALKDVLLNSKLGTLIQEFKEMSFNDMILHGKRIKKETIKTQSVQLLNSIIGGYLNKLKSMFGRASSHPDFNLSKNQAYSKVINAGGTDDSGFYERIFENYVSFDKGRTKDGSDDILLMYIKKVYETECDIMYTILTYKEGALRETDDRDEEYTEKQSEDPENIHYDSPDESDND